MQFFIDSFFVFEYKHFVAARLFSHSSRLADKASRNSQTG